jgi:prolyl oligopeptidase
MKREKLRLLGLHQGDRRTACALLLTALSCTVFPIAALTAPTPPETIQDNVIDIVHGVEIVDPYRWLEDQESPETRAWIAEQNVYTESVLAQIEGREKLAGEISALMRIDKMGVPYHRNGRYFFTRRLADQELEVLCMRQGLEGEDVVLVDPHPLSEDHTKSVDLMGLSDDGSLVIYGIREGGADELLPRMLDVDTRRHLEDVFPRGRYSDISITPDNSGFYYTVYTDAGDRVHFHDFGGDPAADPLIFGEGYGPEMGIASDLSEDGRYLLITVYHGSAARKTEMYYMDFEAGDGIRTIVNDIDSRFEGIMRGGRLFVETDLEAPNGRIMAADLADPAFDGWKEIVPEDSAVLRTFTAAGGRLVASYYESVLPSFKVFEPDGRFVATIEPPTIGYMGYFTGRWQDDEAFFYFSSYDTPSTIYRYDMSTLSRSQWHRIDAPIDSDAYEVRQVWYTSTDGTAVPMFIAHKKGIRLDGSNPTLLTGYGGFRSSTTPYFSARSALWLKMGGVYAAPNLRGGGEFGEEWHRAGMLEQKQNTFDDFIAAAEWLIDQGYTSTDKLAIMGGSNGGLLVGAAMTQRPELFKAVICTYPLLDMVRYHKFLVARWWVPEYGSSEDPEQFKYIYEYSPYHRVVKGTAYPAVMFITGDSDTRVAPLHARKMTALLQASTGSDNPVLLHYDTRAGHSGGTPITKSIEDMTDYVLFLVWQLGIRL